MLCILVARGKEGIEAGVLESGVAVRLVARGREERRPSGNDWVSFFGIAEGGMAPG